MCDSDAVPAALSSRMHWPFVAWEPDAAGGGVMADPRASMPRRA